MFITMWHPLSLSSINFPKSSKGIPVIRSSLFTFVSRVNVDHRECAGRVLFSL